MNYQTKFLIFLYVIFCSCESSDLKSYNQCTARDFIFPLGSKHSFLHAPTGVTTGPFANGSISFLASPCSALPWN